MGGGGGGLPVWQDSNLTVNFCISKTVVYSIALYIFMVNVQNLGLDHDELCKLVETMFNFEDSSYKDAKLLEVDESLGQYTGGELRIDKRLTPVTGNHDIKSVKQCPFDIVAEMLSRTIYFPPITILVGVWER